MVLAIIILVLAVYVYLVMPSREGRAKPWKETLFAHRGLHGGDIQENSREAFAAACVHGYGIELDVQLSRDGEVVVFHDDTLLRMTGDKRRVDQVDYAELKTLSLKGKGTIPTFDEVLRLVNGRVPLLVEIKNGKRNNELCCKVKDKLSEYKGAFVVESFNPLIIAWLRKNAPAFIRGQLVGPWKSYKGTVGALAGFALSGLLLNFKGRPDFIAYDAEARCFFAPHIQRILFRVPMAAWTVREKHKCDACLNRGEMPIFEGFKPKK
ncbi:MAG: glycerophosphodiester phosphodiesterase [Clostridia bacterium]|nr:glycerophosphodiester phosphodiesterase [Clostridia bacterium]